MKTTPLAALLLAAALLSAADAPPEGQPPREGQPQAQRPQRDRGNAQGNAENPRIQRQAERAPASPALSGWVYFPPQGGQNGPIPPKPDFIPGNPGQQPTVAGRNPQPQFGNGPVAPNENGRGGNFQPQAQVQRRVNALTPDEQNKLQATMEKLKDDAGVKEVREAAAKARKEAEESSKKEREVTEAAALKLDPSLAPVFEKMRKGFAAQNQARGNEQPQVRRGEQVPTRRDEPAR